jgi:hypothetical protein
MADPTGEATGTALNLDFRDGFPRGGRGPNNILQTAKAR